VTLGQAIVPERIAYARKPSKLPVVLSADEVVRFLEAIPSLKSRTALITVYAAGLRMSEVVLLKIADRNLRLGRRRVSQGSLRRQLARSALQPPKVRTSQGMVSHLPPWPWMERAPSPSPRMEKAPRNQPQQLRSRHVWNRKWLIRCSRRRSFSSYICCSRLTPELSTSKSGCEDETRG
jgi:integrase